MFAGSGQPLDDQSVTIIHYVDEEQVECLNQYLSGKKELDADELRDVLEYAEYGLGLKTLEERDLSFFFKKMVKFGETPHLYRFETDSGRALKIQGLRDSALESWDTDRAMIESVAVKYQYGPAQIMTPLDFLRLHEKSDGSALKLSDIPFGVVLAEFEQITADIITLRPNPGPG
jgi:hypothetical protein